MTRTAWKLGAAAVLTAAAAAGGAVVLTGADPATGDAETAPATTARVERGRLSAVVALSGTLTYRARPDGSPYAVINQAGGVYTELPDPGDRVDCGGVLYRVDERPVLLLCGAVPAYRALRAGDAGQDVRQLNRTLRVRGAGDAFTARTERALERLQRRTGARVDGSLGRGDAVILPEAVRIAKVAGELGGAARPGARVAQATSETPGVRVALGASQRGQVERGDRAQITLPGAMSVGGTVDRLGRVAQAPPGEGAGAGEATIAGHIGLDEPRKAHGLDRAPVQVEIATEGVDEALSVPVLALVGSGSGFAVEVVRAGGRRGLVAVRLGLFDSTAGRVQVEGRLREGDHVVVPSL